jgi:Fe/S biogenesis protein NfuA
MIYVSREAENHFLELLSKQDPGTQVRVFVMNPNTPGAESCVSYCPKDSVELNDIELKFNGFSIFVDPLSIPALTGAELDVSHENLGSKLTLKAPNAKKEKQGGIDSKSPLLDRVKYEIQEKINPELAKHGGKVSLNEITRDGTALLEFSGGCSGCSMVEFTLTEGIEKHLLSSFPELKKVRDVTNHKRGEHSFY